MTIVTSGEQIIRIRDEDKWKRAAKKTFHFPFPPSSSFFALFQKLKRMSILALQTFFLFFLIFSLLNLLFFTFVTLIRKSSKARKANRRKNIKSWKFSCDFIWRWTTAKRRSSKKMNRPFFTHESSSCTCFRKSHSRRLQSPSRQSNGRFHRRRAKIHRKMLKKTSEGEKKMFFNPRKNENLFSSSCFLIQFFLLIGHQGDPFFLHVRFFLQRFSIRNMDM